MAEQEDAEKMDSSKEEGSLMIVEKELDTIDDPPVSNEVPVVDLEPENAENGPTNDIAESSSNEVPQAKEVRAESEEIDWSDIRVVDEVVDEEAESVEKEKPVNGESGPASSTAEPQEPVENGSSEKEKVPVTENNDATDAVKNGEKTPEAVQLSSEAKGTEAKNLDKDAVKKDSVTKSGDKKAGPEREKAKEEELVPKRTEPVEKVSAYVEGLLNLEYDPKKYTCFYCVPCHGFFAMTSQWEEHICCAKHQKNVCRWRQCLELKGESKDDKKAIKQGEVNSYSDVIVGASNVVEVAEEKGSPKYWVCVLCSAVCGSVELLLGHLTSFLHIDNHMELVEPSMYRPPGKDDRVLNHVRYTSSDIERTVTDRARLHMDKKGKGLMLIYRGNGFQDWPDESPENEEIEEGLAMERMAQLFQGDGLSEEYHFKYKIINKSRSVANEDYSLMTVDSSNTMIGMQYMMEIWSPSRRVTPVYYCCLCNYIVTNWVVHCTILKHCAAYLLKHYKSVFDCVMLECSSEEEFRRVLALAREKVLLLEGRSARVENVVQLVADTNDVFVAVNARIAKRIFDKEKLEIGAPRKAKKRLKGPEGKPKAGEAKGKGNSGSDPKKKPPSSPRKGTSKDSKDTTKRKGDSSNAPPSKKTKPGPSKSGGGNQPQKSAKPSSSSSSHKSGPKDAKSKSSSEDQHRSKPHSSQTSKADRDRKRSRSRSRERRRSREREGRRTDEKRKEGGRRAQEGETDDREEGLTPGMARKPKARIEPPKRRHDERNARHPRDDDRRRERVTSDRERYDRDRRDRREPAPTSRDRQPRERREPLSDGDLLRLEAMLMSVAGIDLGRRLEFQDLDMLRGRLGSDVVEGLLEMIQSTPTQILPPAATQPQFYGRY